MIGTKWLKLALGMSFITKKIKNLVGMTQLTKLAISLSTYYSNQCQLTSKIFNGWNNGAKCENIYVTRLCKEFEQ